MYSQPALFALEYSLAMLWKSKGVVPDALLGHSAGEYVAACFSGALSLEDGLGLIVERARLMQSLPKQDGCMMAVRASEEVVLKGMQETAGLEGVSIAAINGPKSLVVSGPKASVELLLGKLQLVGKALTVSHAFHSPLMAPAASQLAGVVEKIKMGSPSIPVVTNVTGQVVTDAELRSGQHWAQHLVGGVRFADGMGTLRGLGCEVFVEVGPDPTLIKMGRQCLTGARDLVWLASLDRKDEGVFAKTAEALKEAERAGGVAVGSPAMAAAGLGDALNPFSLYKRQPFPWHEVRHPLLQMKSTTADGVVTYRTKLAGKPYGLLKDHQVSGQVIVPGAAYLEAAAAAARDLRTRRRTGTEEDVLVIRDVLFEAPLIINSEEEEAHLQCVVLPDGTYEMQKTVGEEHEAVVVNGRGQLELQHTFDKPVMREAVADVRARCPDEVDAVKMYEILRELGLEFGPRFRTIQRAYRGDKEALGELQVAPESEGWESKFHVHPAVLDGALQLVAVATSGGASNGTSQSDPYLPYSVRRMVVYKAMTGRMWAHARVTGHDKKAITCEVELTDEHGQVIVSLQEVTCRRMSRSASQHRAAAQCLYEVQWSPAQADVSASAISESASAGMGKWLVLGLSECLMPLVRGLLEDKHAIEDVSFVGHQKGVKKAGATADLTDPAHVKALLSSGGWSGVMYGGLLLKESAGRSELFACVLALTHAVLGMEEKSRPADLWLLTQGAQAAGSGCRKFEYNWQSWVSGYAKSVKVEHSGLGLVHVDLDAEAGLEAGVSQQLARLLTGRIKVPAMEMEVCLRGDEVHVPRLMRSGAHFRGPFEVDLSERGAISNLKIQPVADPGRGGSSVREGEVLVRVRAVGLNFRDVLNVMGLYPGDPGQPGSDCAGTVVAVGANVEHVKVGDEVYGMMPGCMRTYVPVVAALVELKPKNLSFEDAASLPSIFSTTEVALGHFAKLRAGERVLIHAATGGVGLAAVQYAQSVGAIIYATAGRKEKHDYLRSLGVQYVTSSRDPDEFYTDMQSFLPRRREDRRGAEQPFRRLHQALGGAPGSARPLHGDRQARHLDSRADACGPRGRALRDYRVG